MLIYKVMIDMRMDAIEASHYEYLFSELEKAEEFASMCWAEMKVEFFSEDLLSKSFIFFDENMKDEQSYFSAKALRDAWEASLRIVHVDLIDEDMDMPESPL